MYRAVPTLPEVKYFNIVMIISQSIYDIALVFSYQGEDGGPAASFATGGGFEFGVDPNEDPELALVSLHV